MWWYHKRRNLSMHPMPREKIGCHKIKSGGIYPCILYHRIKSETIGSKGIRTQKIGFIYLSNRTRCYYMWRYPKRRDLSIYCMPSSRNITHVNPCHEIKYNDIYPLIWNTIIHDWIKSDLFIYLIELKDIGSCLTPSQRIYLCIWCNQIPSHKMLL